MVAAGRTLNTKHREYLRELGLSADAIALYALLLAHGPLTAQAAGGHQGQFASAQYRLFYKLESFGLARRLTGRPLTFEGVSVATAFPAAYLAKETLLKRQLAAITAQPANNTYQLLLGRQALYSKYIELAEKSTDSIDIFAIGIAYSPELVDIQQRVRRRGVRVRHVVQQLKPSNYHVVHAWQRLGVKLRLLTAERGFHLMVFDGSQVLISFSDPTDTDNRVSLLTDNVAALRLFAKYFDEVWDEAREIDA